MAGEHDKLRHEEALALFHEAFEHQRRGELDAAIELYRRSIQTFPTAEAHTFLGWTYSFQGRIEEAIQECLKAIAVDPGFGNPYNDIGAYLLQSAVSPGQIDEAIGWFERALQAPRYESYCFPHFNLGRAYEQKRMYRRALAEYKHAFAENPRHLGAVQGIRRMQALLN
jgi:tetratricopeptide (TPR) repeat protein